MRTDPRSVLVAYAALIALGATLVVALRRSPIVRVDASPLETSYRRVHVTALEPPLATLSAVIVGGSHGSPPRTDGHDVFVDVASHEGFLVVGDGTHAPHALALADVADETVVTLEAARPVRFTVRDDDGLPIAGASVRAVDAPWDAALAPTRTDADGACVLSRPPREAFRVALASAGHVTRVIDSTAIADEVVVLERTALRTFAARDELDAPLASARVWVAVSGAFEPVDDALATPGALALTLPRKTATPVHIETAGGCSAPGLALRGEGPDAARLKLHAGWFQRLAVRSRDGSPRVARVRFGDPDDPRWRSVVATDESGRATLGPLCSGSVTITAESGDATTTVVIRRGEVAEAALVVDSPAGLLVSVFDDDDKALPQVRVTLASSEDEDSTHVHDARTSLSPRGFVPSGELGVTRGPVATLAELERDGFAQGAVSSPTTLADGTLKLTRLPPGRVLVTLRRAGFVPATIGPVELVGGVETTIRGTLSRAARIEGTVVDERGFPQRAYVVRLSDPTGRSTDTVTARDGRFSFDEARSDVVLSVSRGDGEDLERVALHLGAGERVAHDLVVRSSRVREYRIRATDSRGYPVESASVALRPPGGLVRLADARTSRDGTASIAFAEGATLEVFARAAGFAPALVLLDSAKAETVVTLDAIDTRRLFVVDDRRGAPIAGALVWLRATHGDSVVTLARTADRAGILRFDAPLRAAVEIVVSAPDFGTAHLAMPSGAREATVRLAPGVVFEGRVTSSERPIEGATVALEALGRVEPGIAVARTDRDGRFRFPAASLTTRAIDVCARGYRCRRLESLRGDDRRPVDLGSIALERIPLAVEGDLALELRSTSSGLVIERVFPASRAAESGVHTGDVVSLVDEHPADSHLLQGPVGSTVVLTVERGSARERVAVVRERVLR